MKLFHVLIFAVILCQSHSQDEMPRKQNLVSGVVNKLLGEIFEEISSNTLKLEEIDLGEDVGKFLNVEAGIFGGLTKEVDGYKSWGFTLDTNVTNILVKGEYDLVNLDIPGLFPFFGKGNFSIAVNFVNLNVLLDAVYNYQNEKFDIDIPSFNVLVKNSTVKFDNLMNNPHLADFLNELLSNLLPNVVVMLKDPILILLKPVIDHYGNGIMVCIKTKPFAIEKCIKELFGISNLDKIVPSKFAIDLNDIVNLKKFVQNNA